MFTPQSGHPWPRGSPVRSPVPNSAARSSAGLEISKLYRIIREVQETCHGQNMGVGFPSKWICFNPLGIQSPMLMKPLLRKLWFSVATCAYLRPGTPFFMPTNGGMTVPHHVLPCSNHRDGSIVMRQCWVCKPQIGWGFTSTSSETQETCERI